MRVIEINAQWSPQKEYIHERDIIGKRAQSGTKTWKDPKILLAKRDKPQISPTEILIKVRACGFCGSDIAMSTPDNKGYVQYPFMMSSPIIPGHEFSGIVAGLGCEVNKYWPSLQLEDPVTAQCVLNCGFCEFCKAGTFDSCQFSEERGFTIDGAMAEYCVADIRHVWSLVSLKERFQKEKELFTIGSLIEPHCGVFKAITDTGFTPGTNALIIGAGPIGLSALSVFRALGAAQIIVAEPASERCDIATLLHANHTLNPLETSLNEEVLEFTAGEGVSYIFEAAGVAEANWEAITKIIAHSPPGLHFIFFGQSKKDLPVNPQIFIQYYTHFSGSHGHCGVWPQVIKLFASGRINPLPMVTKYISLDKVPFWLKQLRTDKNEGKIIITNFTGGNK